VVLLKVFSKTKSGKHFFLSSALYGQDEQQSTDRLSNVVVFGFTEDQVANVWRQTLDAALPFVMGHTMNVVDAYRIDRFDASKTRQIILKLRSVWDRRFIVSNSYKLSKFAGRMFISRTSLQRRDEKDIRSH